MQSDSLEGGARHFECGGVAASSDLSAASAVALLAELKAKQDAFLAHESQFRSQGYIWYRDALHNWSRVWEYPYVYHHVRRLLAPTQSCVSRIGDIGSGVTFFPFAVATLGCHVLCTDTDPICGRDVPRAAAVVPHAPGEVSFRIGRPYELPFSDGELDAAYCVSVLEHVAQPERLVAEIARCVRTGGRLLLTMDLDLRGDKSIGVPGFQRVVECLESSFHRVYAERTVHPSNILTSANSPWPAPSPAVLGTAYAFAAGRCHLVDVLNAIRQRPPYYLACAGWVFQRQ